MSRQSKTLSSKKKLIALILSGLVALSLIIWGVSSAYFFKGSQGTGEILDDMPLTSSEVVEGSLSSSTLLSGTVHALSEQYVYYDSNQSQYFSLTVKVGDQVTKGQQLVQYDTTNAQATYDQAVRALNKVNRQINHLYNYGNLPTTTTSFDEETGEETTTTVQPSAQDQATYNDQMQDLYDAQADAQLAINKAQEGLNQTMVLSDVDGTVVEANTTIDPSAKQSQTLVHVTSQGQLQVKGSLTEYDLANVKVGQVVKLTSKVYPDKEWSGTISYVSNYPSQGTSGEGGASTGAASYEYKIDITSDLGELRQGSTVSVEVVNDKKSLLVPVTAVVPDGDKHFVWVYDKASHKINRVEVTLGSADAINQEILSGLEAGKQVITMPKDDFKEGQKLKDVQSFDDMGTDLSETDAEKQ
ncbi:efflux RND transporter periplasmic adaptor subunit [Streptococcus fryi]